MKLAPTSLSDYRQTLPTVHFGCAKTLLEDVSNIKLWLTLAVLLPLATPLAPLAAEIAIVREVLVSKEGNGARIEIRANRPLIYKSYLMSGLEKWVVDLPGAKPAGEEDESRKMRTVPLERITVKHKEVNGDLLARIGLDFKGSVDFSLKEDPLDKGHLIILMTPSKTAPQIRSADAATPAVPQSFPATKNK